MKSLNNYGVSKTIIFSWPEYEQTEASRFKLEQAGQHKGGNLNITKTQP